MDLKSRLMMTPDTACKPGAVFEFCEQNTSAQVDPSVAKAMKKAGCT